LPYAWFSPQKLTAKVFVFPKVEMTRSDKKISLYCYKLIIYSRSRLMNFLPDNFLHSDQQPVSDLD